MSNLSAELSFLQEQSRLVVLLIIIYSLRYLVQNLLRLNIARKWYR